MELEVIVEAQLMVSMSSINEFSNKRVILKSIQQIFTYKNPKFIENEKWGYSNHCTNKFLTSYEIKDDVLHISRGGKDKLHKHLKKLNITPKYIDRTLVCESVYFEQSNVVRRNDQEKFLRQLMKYAQGCGQAYTSFGKTLTLLELAKELKQPTLIIVHTTFLQEQWIKEACGPFNLDPKDIGGVGGLFGNKKSFKEYFPNCKFENRRYRKLNICLYHSLQNTKHLDFFKDRIGLVLFDEGQKTPIDAVQGQVNRFRARYRYAASAEFRRKDGKEFLTFDTFGPIRSIAVERNSASKILSEIHLVSSPTEDDQYSEDGNYSGLISRVSKDHERNILICKRAIRKVREGKLVLILVERKIQAGILAKLLSKFRVDMLLGGVNTSLIKKDESLPLSVKRILCAYDGKTAYKRIETLANKKNLDIIIGTQKAEVGLNIRTIDHEIITTPIGKNPERFKQCKGRVERTYSDEQVEYFGHKKATPTVDVIVDHQIRPSRDAADTIKEIWGDAVKIIKKKQKVLIRKKEK